MTRARAILAVLCVVAACDDGASGARDAGDAGGAGDAGEGGASGWPPRTGSLRVEPPVDGAFRATRDVFDAAERAEVVAVALGDCDGDGLLDALALGARGGFALYRGDGAGGFARTDAGLPAWTYPAAVFADVDGDGREDVVAAERTVTVFRNEGGCRFGAPRVVAPLADEVARQLLVTDVNLDGLADFSVTHRNAATSPHRLLVARGDGSYDEYAPRPTPYRPDKRREPTFIGFSMYYEDVDGDGAQDLFGLLDQRQAWFAWGERPGDLGRLRDEALTEALGRADAMGVSPIDFDRDGRVDWFVPGVYGESRLLWHRGGRDLRDVADRADVAGVGDYFAWGSYGFDADLDGWPDLLVLRQGPDASPDAPVTPGPFDLFLNRRDGTFVEVGGRAIGWRLQARGLHCGPLSPRGPVGCFAMDRAGPVFFLDALRPRGRQALLRLRGTVSAFDGTGARVSVEGESVVWVVGGQSTFGGEHARVLQLPLGDRAEARVTVRWPSGVEQRGVEVRADDLATAVEPEAVVVAPRVIRADGAATAEVTVDPSAAGASRVELALEGDGAWAGEAVTDAEGRVRRVIRAPSAPGEARVAVTLDGVALRVRPRVVFAR